MNKESLISGRGAMDAQTARHRFEFYLSQAKKAAAQADVTHDLREREELLYAAQMWLDLATEIGSLDIEARLN